MQYENRVIDKEKGIVRITTESERWYRKPLEDGTFKWIPSTTWISSYWPKGPEYEKWRSSHTQEEADTILMEKGDFGTHVHKGSEILLNGGTLRFDTIVDDRPLTTEEYAGVMSFVEWFNEYKPVIKETECTVFSPDDRYSGTLDLYCHIKGEPWIIDFKTSPAIYMSHKIQVSAYKHAFNPEAKTAILQLAYKYNKKKKWKFTEIEDCFEQFNLAYGIWQTECAGMQPLQRDFPLELKLKLKKEEIPNEAA